MAEVGIIGVDLAKNVFQVHGAAVDGSVLFRKKLSRAQVLPFLSQQPNCIVAMEACATSHGWAREIGKLGHTTKLIPPQYVKPYLKRQKNDAADAEAIAEAASRPTMRFVEVKSVEQQARAMVFRTRQMFIRQRTQTANALRAHLSEHGVIGPRNKIGIKRLAMMLEDENVNLPTLVRETARIYLGHIDVLNANISQATTQMNKEAKHSRLARRVQTMPGVGVQTAMAIEAFAPDMACFKRGRDFSAWLGLVPKQHSTGGKERLGKVAKKGQTDIRSLLICGAMSVISAGMRVGIPKGCWLERLLARKPRMQAAIALANRMARAIWAMLSRKEDYRNFEAAAAA